MKTCVTTRHIVGKCCSEKRVAKRQILPIMASEVGSLKAEIGILIRVAERFFSGVPQPPPPWRLLPESFLFAMGTEFPIDGNRSVQYFAAPFGAGV